MKIIDVICAKGRTGFFFDDQKAIKTTAQPDGATYAGQPITSGFTAVRQAGEAVSVMLVLEDGQVAYGDCAAVQYSGAGGRDPLFLAEDFIPVIEKNIGPWLRGRELTDFRFLSQELEELRCLDTKQPLHTAIRYGISQAILDAVAKSRHLQMCEVVADEYNLKPDWQAIPIFSQSGDNRYDNADKMIIKHADVLPHALINHVKTKLGPQGELLLAYIQWLKERIIALRVNENYQPVLHIDVYGTIGEAFDLDQGRMVAYLKELAEAAAPFKLRIEGPMDVGDRLGQMKALQELTAAVDAAGLAIELVADEWCNTFEDIKAFADLRAGHMIQIKTPDLGAIHNVIEAVLYCKEKGIGAYQGGTCNETDRSAQVCTQLAMACEPDQILAKPGMGVDEGYMIVFNEMQRMIALMKHKRSEITWRK
jgi:methylaspartate ammonia-lyase